MRTVTGEFDLSDPDNPSFDLDPIEQEVGTCKVYNSYDYAPDIALTKVNTPTSLRGDLDPPATVTSDFEVTNPGEHPTRQRIGDRRRVRGGRPGPRHGRQCRGHGQQRPPQRG